MAGVNQRELNKAKKELEAFLEAHPHLRDYQKEINRVLDSSTNRLEVLFIMLAGKLSDLNCHMQELLYSLDEYSHHITLGQAA